MTDVLTDPPEGVLAGENVPRENDDDSAVDQQVERLAVALADRDAYRGTSIEDRREAARERLHRHGVLP